VRWTRDLVPVVFHDPDTRRLLAPRIGRYRSNGPGHMKKRFPLIPTLAAVVDRYGGRSHLMIELKAESYPAPSIQSRRMKRLLRHLDPGTDFHLMGLQPDLFGHFGIPAGTGLFAHRPHTD
jgi:glycerophosphoryl diester phosphodiesterase